MSDLCEVVLVCGGRDYRNKQFVYATLDEIAAEHGIDVLVHGGARGVDTFADLWAQDRGVQPVRWDALWKAEGLSAGPQRNGRMFEFMRPTRVVAFPGGRGTNNMIARVVRAKKEGEDVVLDVRDDH